jgi:hypothetical protein
MACRELAELTISAGLISQEAGKQLKELMKVGVVTLALNWTDSLPKSSEVRIGAGTRGCTGLHRVSPLCMCVLKAACAERRVCQLTGE